MNDRKMDELQTCISVQVGNSSQDDQEEPVREVRNIYSDRRDCIAIKEKLMKLVNKEEYSETLIAYLRGSCSKQFFDEKMSLILTTPAAKIIHNDLIRSILFNAHFTMTPPPNVQTPIPQVPQHIEKGKHSTMNTNSFISNMPNPISNYLNDNLNLDTPDNSNNFTFQKFKKSQMNPLKEMKNYTAYNMRHLPSIYQLTSRIENLVVDQNINSVDIKATKIIFHELKTIIITLLKYSLICHQNNNSNDNPDDKDDADINSNNDNNQSDSLIKVSEVLNAIEGNEKLYSIISLRILSKYSSLVNK